MSRKRCAANLEKSRGGKGMEPFSMRRSSNLQLRRGSNGMHSIKPSNTRRKSARDAAVRLDVFQFPGPTVKTSALSRVVQRGGLRAPGACQGVIRGVTCRKAGLCLLPSTGGQKPRGDRPGDVSDWACLASYPCRMDRPRLRGIRCPARGEANNLHAALEAIKKVAPPKRCIPSVPAVV